MINQRAQAREHGQSKRIGRGREQNKEREQAREANKWQCVSTRSWQRTLRSGIVCLFFRQQSLIFRSLSFRRPNKWPCGGWNFQTQPSTQNINQYFSSRSSFGLCFCVYQVKRFSFIKSNQFRLVLIFKTRTKHQTKPANNYKFEPNFHSKFYCQWNFTEFGWTVVSRHWGKNSLLEMVQRSELAQLNPQFLSKGLLKRVSIAERRNWKLSKTKRNRKKKPDERQSQRTSKATHNNKRKRKASFCF